MDKFSRKLTESELKQVTGGVSLNQGTLNGQNYYEIILNDNDGTAQSAINNNQIWLSVLGFTTNSINALKSHAQTMDNNNYRKARAFYTKNGNAITITSIESVY